jgi:hypothetical protein
MAEPTADAGAHGSDDAGGTKPFRVFQTQAEFDAHSAGIRQAAERKAKSVTPDERAKLDALEAELATHKQRDLEAAGNYEQAKAAIEKAAQDRIAKETARAQKLADRLRANVQAQVAAFASAHGAYDPEDVVVRVMPRVSVDDDGAVHVLDAPGGAVQTDLSLEQAVTALLADKAHLAKPSGNGTSAGARGSASSTVSGSPAERAARATYDEAVKAAAANPTNQGVLAAVLAAKAGLKQASAK